MDASVTIPARDDAAMDAVTLLPAMKKIWGVWDYWVGYKYQRGLHLDLQVMWPAVSKNNATKVIHYVLKIKKQNIKLCMASIPTMYLHRYADFYDNSAITRQERKAESVSSFFFVHCLLLSMLGSLLGCVWSEQRKWVARNVAHQSHIVDSLTSIKGKGSEIHALMCQAHQQWWR